jgi:hypothetical protein
MLSLQFGELPAFRGVVGKIVIGEEKPLEQCQTAYEILNSWMRVAGLRING